MNTKKKSVSMRVPWLICTLAAALSAAALRKWQLDSAFEPDTGLAIPMAPASVTLACLLVIDASWFLILATHQPISKQPWPGGRTYRWDLVFLDTGDPMYPMLVVSAAFVSAASAPFLLGTGIDQWQTYQAAVKAGIQPPSNNGILTLATAVGALLSFLGLLQIGRDGFHAGRRGKGGFAAALPGVAGCVWLMESFRAHAANPVRWDYAPQLIAIVCGMLLYMDFAGMSAGTARPRRLLWLTSMTVVMSAPALVSAAAWKVWADVLLLTAQTLTAAAVLWRLPPSLENPPKQKGTPIPQPGEARIEEETTDE